MELVVSAEDIVDRWEVLRRRLGSEEVLRHSLLEAGLSKEQFKQQIREQLLVEQVVDQAVRSKISVSPREVAQELEERPQMSESGELVEASHIVVRVNESRSEEQARERIEGIYQALEAGEEFAALAMRYSDDPNAEQGGAMGWVAPGMLMPELDTAVFTLRDGTFSAPIRTRLGFHIVQVGSRRAASSLSALDAKRGVERRLFERKFQEAFVKWLTGLKSRAFIEIRPTS